LKDDNSNKKFNTGDPLFYISSHSDNLGAIMNCNMSAVRLLGYEKNKILGNDIEQYMPSIYAEHHKEALELYDKDNPNYELKTHFGFVVHKSGFIVPITVRMIGLPSIYNDGCFVGVLTQDEIPNQYSAYIIIDLKYVIMYISSSFIGFFVGTKDSSEVINCSLFDLFPDFLGKESAMSSKCGVRLNIYNQKTETSLNNINCLLREIIINNKVTGYYLQMGMSIGLLQYGNKLGKKTKCKFAFSASLNTYIRDDQECKILISYKQYNIQSKLTSHKEKANY
jgi:PAS domain S-box-containing protein